MLPQVPNKLTERETRTITLRGINYTDSYSEGHMAYTKNISDKRYPYITTAYKTESVDEEVQLLDSWNKLFMIKSGNLYYGEDLVGEVGTSVTQMVMINTRLVLWPVKKYVDMNTMTIKDLGMTLTVESATFKKQNPATETTETTSDSTTDDEEEETDEGYWEIVVSGDITDTIKEDDALIISGCANAGNNRTIKDGGAPVSEIEYNTEDSCTHMVFMTEEFVAATETNITFSKPVPDMDYICESENRLWGCSNETKTIYACALGDPTVWYDYSGESTDSYAVAVGSRGDFTGCTKHSSSVLFWKENTLHKMLGGYPAEYSMYTYEFDGLKKGCFRSLKLVNETLYYIGTKGVYSYSGSTPQLISTYLGDIEIEDGAIGSDGDTLYVSGKVDGTAELYTFSLKYGTWIRQDSIQVTQFTNLDGELYALKADGTVVKTTDEQMDDEEWEIRFKPVIETVSGSYNSTTILFNRKRYSNIIMRMELSRHSSITAYTRFDEGPWKNCGTVSGETEDIRQFVIPINRCDKFELKLTGKGICTILGMVRRYSMGSAK